MSIITVTSVCSSIVKTRDCVVRLNDDRQRSVDFFSNCGDSKYSLRNRGLRKNDVRAELEQDLVSHTS